MLEYVEKNGKDPLEFAYSYNNNKNTIIKFLVILSILHGEWLSIENLNDPSIALRVIQGESEMDIMKSMFNSLRPEAVEEIEELLDKETSYLDLTPEQVNRLDRYHYEYMDKNIYPHLTDNNSVNKQEDRGLKLASKLGSKQIRK